MIELMHGDCLELMKSIPDGSIDMILCDLPYGTTKNKWDVVIPLDALWLQYERVIKENGAVVLFSQMPFTSSLVESKKKLFKYEWIWIKDNATGFLNSKIAPLKIHENILVFYRKPPTYNPQMRTGFKPYVQRHKSHSTNYGTQTEGISRSDGERFPIDILNFSRGGGTRYTLRRSLLHCLSIL